MNTLPSAEIRRRGLAALEESLKQGPVHILKRNRPAAVVLSEEEYQRLCGRVVEAPSPDSAIAYLLALPAGDQQPEVLTARTEQEREAW